MQVNLQEILEGVSNYLDDLNYDEFLYFSNKSSIFDSYNLPRLGNSCYAIKLKIILDEWKDIDHNTKERWISFLTSFQNHSLDGFGSYFVDEVIYNYHKENSNKYKDVTKVIVNKIANKNFKTSFLKLTEAINAETKQTVSTIYDAGFKNENFIMSKYKNSSEAIDYLNKLNWSFPWNAGGQFASLCLYSSTQSYNFDNELKNFISSLIDEDTGAYFLGRPKSSREIINGSMKVISGLDWLNVPIHNTSKLIDFCLQNRPDAEGCDVVDYVYVLFSCSSQTDYRKKEIITIFDEILLFLIEKLYKKEDGAFSYFPGKSQTHYYGYPVSDGSNQSDLHGTLLSMWAISMIQNTKESESNFKLIKP